MVFWQLLDPPSDLTLLIRNIIIILTTTHNLCILLYHCYHTLECFTKSKPKQIQRLSILVLVFIFLFTLQNIFIAWLKLNELNDTLWCKWMFIGTGLLWTASKMTMYFLFLERLFISFQSSGFLQFKSSQILLSRIVLTTYWIAFSLLTLFTCDGKIVNNACFANLPNHLYIIAGIVDMTTCTAIAILFSRKLLLLRFESIFKSDLKQASSESQKDDDLLAKMLRKFTILSFVALFTTQFSLIIMVVIGVSLIWASTDSVVNTWCVILMFSVHKKIYSNICERLEVLTPTKFLICFSCIWCKINVKKKIETEDINVQKTENVNDRKLETSEKKCVI